MTLEPSVGGRGQVGDSIVGSVMYCRLDAELVSCAYQKAPDFLVLWNVSTHYHVNEGMKPRSVQEL